MHTVLKIDAPRTHSHVDSRPCGLPIWKSAACGQLLECSNVLISTAFHSYYSQVPFRGRGNSLSTASSGGVRNGTPTGSHRRRCTQCYSTSEGIKRGSISTTFVHTGYTNIKQRIWRVSFSEISRFGNKVVHELVRWEIESLRITNLGHQLPRKAMLTLEKDVRSLAASKGDKRIDRHGEQLWKWSKKLKEIFVDKGKNKSKGEHGIWKDRRGV